MTREKAIEILQGAIKTPNTKDGYLGQAIDMAIKALKQEPRKGHWIIDTHKIRAFGEKNETHDYSVHCDKCNYAWDYTTDKEGSLVSNFCPNCGAEMKMNEVEE